MINNNDNIQNNLDSTIFEAIALLGVPVEATELAIELDLAVAIVRSCLNELVNEGRLAEEFGRYYLAEQPAEEEEKNEDMGTVICLEAKKEELSVYALRRQEKIIEAAERTEQAGTKAIFAKGQALKTIRDDRLYRNTNDTFDQYCTQKWNYKRNYSYKAIAAFNIFENIRSVYNCTQGNTKAVQVVLPSSEGQIRPLSKLQTPLQFQIWQEAVELTNGKPTGKVVNQLVKDFLRAEQDELDDNLRHEQRFCCHDVVRIDAKDDPDLKPFHGSWATIDQFNDPFYTIICWCGVSTVARQRQLKPMKNCDRDRAIALNQKLNAVRFVLENEETFDPGAWAIIKTIGRLDESQITASVEKLVDSLLEAKGDR